MLCHQINSHDPRLFVHFRVEQKDSKQNSVLDLIEGLFLKQLFV